jgi:hypothetical protein
MYIIIDVCLYIFMYTQGGIERREIERERERERERQRGAEREIWGCHLHLIKWDGDATCVFRSEMGDATIHIHL